MFQVRVIVGNKAARDLFDLNPIPLLPNVLPPKEKLR